MIQKSVLYRLRRRRSWPFQGHLKVKFKLYTFTLCLVIWNIQCICLLYKFSLKPFMCIHTLNHRCEDSPFLPRSPCGGGGRARRRGLWHLLGCPVVCSSDCPQFCFRRKTQKPMGGFLSYWPHTLRGCSCAFCGLWLWPTFCPISPFYFNIADIWPCQIAGPLL